MLFSSNRNEKKQGLQMVYISAKQPSVDGKENLSLFNNSILKEWEYGVPHSDYNYYYHNSFYIEKLFFIKRRKN